MKVEVKGDFGKKRLEGNFEKAQQWLDNEVIKDTDKYVPMKQGILKSSVIRSTVIGSGEVIYSTPYARRLYYGVSFNFDKRKHPQAQAYWFEASKAVNKNKWIRVVKKIGGKD